MKLKINNILLLLKQYRWLVLLTLLGLVLRVSSIGWGMGLGETSGYYHPDEHKAWRSITNFPENYLSNQRFEYGTALQYSLGILCYPINYGWESAQGLFGGISRVQFNILAFRLVNCFLGAGCVILVFLLGRKIYDDLTAWLAAGLVSVGFYHVVNSPLCCLDVPMSFFVTLHFLLVPWAFARKTPGVFVVLGLATGYLMGMKIYAFFIGVLPLIYLLSSMWEEREHGWLGAVKRWIKPMLIYALVAVLTTFISTPHIFLRFGDYVEWMTTRTELWHYADMHEASLIKHGWVRAFKYMFTPVLAIFPLLGFFVSSPGRRHPYFKLWLSMPLLVMTILLFWGGWLPPRYLLFVYAILVLFIARMIARLWQLKHPVARGASVILGIFIFSWTAGSTVLGIKGKYQDTRSISARYLYEKLPEGARLTMANAPEYVDWSVHSWRFPKINSDRYELVSIFDEPEYIVTSEVNLSRMWLSFHINQVDEDCNWIGDMWWIDGKIPTREEFLFYRDQLFDKETYELVNSWQPDSALKIPFIGKEIRLYRKK